MFCNVLADVPVLVALTLQLIVKYIAHWCRNAFRGKHSFQSPIDHPGAMHKYVF